MISNSVLRQPNTRPTSYDEVVEMIKTVPAECLSDISNYIGYVLYCYNGRDEKIRKLKNAIQEGEESGICDNFDADSFLKTLKSERKNG